jgi:hypothetical protein
LWHLNWSCQESGQGLDEQKSQKIMGIHKWIQTGKGTYIRALCQKNKGFVEMKQSHLKGHLFKLGLTDDRTSERCLEEDESATHVLYDCEAIAHLRFRHLGQFFMEPSDSYDALIIKVLHIIRSVGLIRGNQRGSTIDQQWSRCRGTDEAHPSYSLTTMTYYCVVTGEQGGKTVASYFCC